MWKKKLTNTVATALLTCFLFFFYTGQAQKMHMVKGYCGIYYYSMDDLYRQKQVELDFYQFKPGQTIASIGAQCGHWEAVYAAATDSMQFYLEDIDSSFFNQRQVAFAWHYYDSLRGRPITSSYKLVLGTERSTNLPENSFDKITIINSFHEFTYYDEMLADIKTKLKPSGLLYIDETVPKKQGQLHGVCKKPMLTQEEMIAILSKNGFRYVNAVDINFRKNKLFRRIYAFQKH